MEKWIIIHNPKCSKSRQSLQILKDHAIEPEVLEYLKHPLSEKQLRDIVHKLGVPPGDLVRTKEQDFKESPFNTGDNEEVFLQLSKRPVLLERPIIVHGSRAVLGRPPENVETLIHAEKKRV